VSAQPRPLPPLRPENAAASARILLEVGIPVSALKGVMTTEELAQIEAALTDLTAPGGAA
jgi:hypothetical protein